MTARRFTRPQRAATLVPLALLSAAWTANLAGVGGPFDQAGAQADDPTSQLPDGTEVPTQAIEQPASYTKPGSVGLGVPVGKGRQIVRTASTNSIPSAALGAYQRAETVINAADKGCRIPWQLIAAIGRVESDHGRVNNNTLGKDGQSRPGIFGIALDGKNGTRKISDTDGGALDRDVKFDRAVGPMQFIPATWRSVGVDADGDGDRLPQDMDDAALGTAVYLCSGSDDLSKEKGQRAAIYRYNHSQKYVDLVLSIMRAYMTGDYTSVPNSTTSAITFTPTKDYTRPTFNTKAPKSGNGGGGNSSAAPGGSTSTGGGGTTGGTDGGSTPPGGGTDGSNPPPSIPTKPPKVNVPEVPDIPKTVDDVLTRTQASLKCISKGYIDNILRSDDPFDKCMDGYGY